MLTIGDRVRITATTEELNDLAITFCAPLVSGATGTIVQVVDEYFRTTTALSIRVKVDNCEAPGPWWLRRQDINLLTEGEEA